MMVADILTLAREPMKKTWIMEKANLNSKKLTELLKLLLDRRLLVRAGGDFYKATPTGFDFLQYYRTLRRMVGEFM